MRKPGAQRRFGALGAAVALVAGLTAAGVRAADLNLDPQAITRAFRSTLDDNAIRARATEWSQTIASRPRVPPEVVTPFRRIVLTAQARGRAIGDGDSARRSNSRAMPRQIDLYAD
jgi:hypothetical protein